MDMKRLIYASQPFGFDDAILNGILSDARRENLRNGVTGALICRADVYLQLIEGPAEAVDATFARIAKDDRHGDVRVLLERRVEERLFPDWAMKDDPARSWMWTPREVAGGALSDAKPDALLAVFRRVAAEPD